VLSIMTTPADVAVIPRDVHFRTDCARGTAWLGGDPVATAVFNALSLTFPDGERLFIDSVRAFQDQLPRELAAEVRAFIAQEALHSREHANLNAHLDRRHYPVEWIETTVRRRLAFLRRLGPMRMLGVTIALEHFTAMLADMFDSDPQLWDGTPEEILRLWRWRARWQVTRFLFGEPGIFRKIGARYRDWYRPTFHPWDHDNRAKLAEWRKQFG
jgi:predicted metal-dependent hydrolase